MNTATNYTAAAIISISQKELHGVGYWKQAVKTLHTVGYTNHDIEHIFDLAAPSKLVKNSRDFFYGIEYMVYLPVGGDNPRDPIAMNLPYHEAVNVSEQQGGIIMLQSEWDKIDPLYEGATKAETYMHQPNI